MGGKALLPAQRTGGRPTILFVAPSAKFFLSHRLPLAIGAQKAGFDTAVACPQDVDSARLAANGIRHYAVPVHRGGLHPLADSRTLWRLHGVMRRMRPSVVHLITAKPALLGGLAARSLGVPTLTAITGLGSVFVQESASARLAQGLLFNGYRAGLSHSRNIFIFQNTTDLGLFRQRGLLRKAEAHLVPGSGVDLQKIAAQPLPGGTPVILMPSRMLRDKGVVEFAQAASLLQQRSYRARYQLLGSPDLDNPTSLTEAELRRLSHDTPVEWHPYTEDVGSYLAAASIVVLPSYYREGLPKTLIDAAAAGRVAVTTDTPGCRDAIVPGRTGLLCRPRDPVSLADTIAELLDDPHRIVAMGAEARRHAERHFDIASVVDTHLGMYDRLHALNSGRPDPAKPKS